MQNKKASLLKEEACQKKRRDLPFIYRSRGFYSGIPRINVFAEIQF